MIWVRRLLAILLGILFVPIFLLTLLAFRVNDTFIEPDFYIEQLRKAYVYNFLFDELIPVVVDEKLEDVPELPFDSPYSNEELVSSVQKVVPPEWIQKQVEGVIDEVGLYLTGETESFEVTIPLAERAEVALAEIKNALRDADTYNFLFDDVITPVVEENVGLLSELPFGVTITSDEVMSAVKEVVPPEWVQKRVDELVDEVGIYLIGEAQGFEIIVPLEDQVDVALQVLDELADRKLDNLLGGLPRCNPAQMSTLGEAGSLTRIPDCLPLGVTPQVIKSQLDIDISGAVKQFVGDQLPSSFTYSNIELRRALSDAGQGETVEIVDQVRDLVSEGFTYTDADFRQDLEENVDEDAVDALDQFRDGVSDARRYQWVAFLVLVIFLLAIGILGGRRITSKLAWATVFLVTAAAIAYAASGPIYKEALEPELHKALIGQTEDLKGTDLLVANKGITLVENVARDFLSWIETVSLVTLIISGIAFGVAFIGPPLVKSFVPPSQKT